MRVVITLCLVGLAFIVGNSRLCAQVIDRAEFNSHTNDEDKDNNTAVFVEVMTNDLQTKIAEVDGGDGSKQYKNGSDNSLGLVVKATGITKDKCAKFKFRVGSQASGNDKWEFRGQVSLYFKDGTNLVQNIGNVALNSRHNTKVWTEGWAGGQ